MANEVKQGSYQKVGNCDTQVRKTLIETTVIPSVLANTETWTEVTCGGLAMLNKEQYKMMRTAYEMPKGTPYYGLINVTGMWPFSFTVMYKQLMWYHTLIHSEDSRIAKQILMKQLQNENDESWARQVREWAGSLNVNLKIKEEEKQNNAAFKKHTKEQIRKQIEAVIKEEACKKNKMRFLQNERFEEKEYIYMKQCSLTKNVSR